MNDYNDLLERCYDARNRFEKDGQPKGLPNTEIVIRDLLEGCETIDVNVFPPEERGGFINLRSALRTALTGDEIKLGWNKRPDIVQVLDKLIEMVLNKMAGAENDTGSQPLEPSSHKGSPTVEKPEMGNQADPKRVFIIHGRNHTVKYAIEQFVRSLGLSPLDFEEVASTLGAAFIGDIVRKGMDQAQGIIALFTPDEEAHLRPEWQKEQDTEEDNQRYQARPNVIFEAGMAYGMARERTIVAVLGAETNLFSDLHGVHLTYLDNSMKARSRLREKLIGAGCNVDQKTSVWTDAKRSGDFESFAPVEIVHPR